MIRKALFVFASVAVLAVPASGQTVYRCGNSYGTQPCTGGAPIDVSDKRTSAEAARSNKVVAQDTALADRMEKARLAQEKNAPKALVIGPKDPPPKAEPPEHAKAHKDKKMAKGKADDPAVFTAAGPKPPKAEKAPKAPKK